MKKIPLTRGQFALVSDEDFEYINQWKWFCHATGYACRQERTDSNDTKSRQKTIRMHRVISNAVDGFDVDHINHNRLDNTRENLRQATRSQNCHNKITGKRGASFHKIKRKWQSRISVQGKEKHLGAFDTKEEAYQAYDMAAKLYFNDFAFSNISVSS